MILYIDSSEKEEFSLGLYNKENKLVLKVVKCPIGTMSEKFLVELENFLKSNKSNLKNLLAIIVFQGPGSYTSLRIGISIANALAWGLDIPILGTKTPLVPRCPSGTTGKDRSAKLKAKNFSLKLKRKIRFNKPIKPFYQQEIG